MKYFSIAARVHKMNVWHPLWLPKIIVDAAEEMEEKECENAFISQMEGQGHEMALSYPRPHAYYTPKVNSEGSHLDTPTILRGNDGLVPILSAKWGTFLGVVEGCNHWDIRGAGSTSRRGSGSPTREDAGQSGMGLGRIGLGFDWEDGWKAWRDWVGAVSSKGESRPEVVSEKGRNDALTSMQEAISTNPTAIIPNPVHPNANTGSSDATTIPTHVSKAFPRLTSKDSTWASAHGFSDEGHRFDLERFYIALCRKLYDEGL